MERIRKSKMIHHIICKRDSKWVVKGGEGIEQRDEHSRVGAVEPSALEEELSDLIRNLKT